MKRNLTLKLIVQYFELMTFELSASYPNEFVSRIIEVFESFNKIQQQWQGKYSPVEVKFGNGIFVQKDFPVQQSFKDILKKYFDTEAYNLDISGDAKGSTDFINK